MKKISIELNEFGQMKLNKTFNEEIVPNLDNINEKFLFSSRLSYLYSNNNFYTDLQNSKKEIQFNSNFFSNSCIIIMNNITEMLLNYLKDNNKKISFNLFKNLLLSLPFYSIYHTGKYSVCDNIVKLSVSGGSQYENLQNNLIEIFYNYTEGTLENNTKNIFKDRYEDPVFFLYNTFFDKIIFDKKTLFLEKYFNYNTFPYKVDNINCCYETDKLLLKFTNRIFNKIINKCHYFPGIELYLKERNCYIISKTGLLNIDFSKMNIKKLNGNFPYNITKKILFNNFGYNHLSKELIELLLKMFEKTPKLFQTVALYSIRNHIFSASSPSDMNIWVETLYKLDPSNIVTLIEYNYSNYINKFEYFNDNKEIILKSFSSGPSYRNICYKFCNLKELEDYIIKNKLFKSVTLSDFKLILKFHPEEVVEGSRFILKMTTMKNIPKGIFDLVDKGFINDIDINIDFKVDDPDGLKLFLLMSDDN